MKFAFMSFTTPEASLQEMLDIAKNKHAYFIVGSHFRFPTYMIVGVVYPTKKDLGI